MIPPPLFILQFDFYIEIWTYDLNIVLADNHRNRRDRGAPIKMFIKGLLDCETVVPLHLLWLFGGIRDVL
jgi:hypothetical protein